jgi:hypothetical protein
MEHEQASRVASLPLSQIAQGDTERTAEGHARTKIDYVT